MVSCRNGFDSQETTVQKDPIFDHHAIQDVTQDFNNNQIHSILARIEQRLSNIETRLATKQVNENRESNEFSVVPTKIDSRYEEAPVCEESEWEDWDCSESDESDLESSNSTNDSESDCDETESQLSEVLVA